MGPTEARPLPRQIGRYRILCELGHGAMAVIYLGRAMGLKNFERLFAIKTIHDHLARERAFVDMFLDEARLAARIHHPNVIPVYDVDVYEGRYFIAMDYVSGESLAAALRDTWSCGRPFPTDIAMHVLAEACEGLHAAHELSDADGHPLGVVHRDVAPQNIMLGYDGAVRVMDFGIAKALDRVGSTRPGTLKGTVAYMAPEQIRCEDLDRRGDVFSLGVILWETVVGKRLFKSESDINTAARVLRMNIPVPSSIRPGCPKGLDEIVMRALERDPTKRYPTARSLGEALRDQLAREHGRVGAPGVERFMKDVFGAVLEDRREMEKKARAPEPPDHVSAPHRSDNGSSLEELKGDVGDVFDAFGGAIENAEPSDFDNIPTDAAVIAPASVGAAGLRFTAPRSGTAPPRRKPGDETSVSASHFEQGHGTAIIRERPPRSFSEAALSATPTARLDTRPLVEPDVRTFDTASADPDIAAALGEVQKGWAPKKIALVLSAVLLSGTVLAMSSLRRSSTEDATPAQAAHGSVGETPSFEAKAALEPEQKGPPEPEAAKAAPQREEAKAVPQREEAKAAPQREEAKAVPPREEATPPSPHGRATPPPPHEEAKAAPQHGDATPPPQHEQAKAAPEHEEAEELQPEESEPARAAPAEASHDAVDERKAPARAKKKKQAKILVTGDDL